MAAFAAHEAQHPQFWCADDPDRIWIDWTKYDQSLEGRCILNEHLLKLPMEKVPPHVRHTNHLEILRDNMEVGETVHPLELKDIQRSTAGEQAMDLQQRDEYVGKLKLLE